MTTEEYIENENTDQFNYEDRLFADINIKQFAYNAVFMAREEDNKKAINAFEGVIIYMISEMEQGRNPKDLKEKFVTLLNK